MKRVGMLVPAIDLEKATGLLATRDAPGRFREFTPERMRCPLLLLTSTKSFPYSRSNAERASFNLAVTGQHGVGHGQEGAGLNT